MVKTKIFTQKGKSNGEVVLEAGLFEAPVNESLVAQYVRYYVSQQHRDPAPKKTRSDVRGGGRKPWRQKGTGRARHGSRRSPLWVGGGIVHGPKPHRTLRMPEKMKKAALASALTAQVERNGVVVIDTLALTSHKTKEFVSLLQKLPVHGRILVVVEQLSRDLLSATRNVPDVEVVTASSLNAYDVLLCHTLLIEEEALGTLNERLLLKGGSEGVKEAGKKKAPTSQESIESLSLSSRIEGALRKGGIKTVDQLSSLSEEELLSVKGIGVKGVERIQAALSDKGTGGEK